jgi:L-ascorbate metabolism protein UlaG (beta-lactamase superfamily)
VSARALQLEWFGCTTFRVRANGLTLFFDTYVDRPPGVPEVGLSARDVTEADFVFVSHAHFDHMLGVDTIALATGATVVCSYEVARVMRTNGVPDAQILPVSGGEPVDCGRDVRVRPYPSLHSCLFATSNFDSRADCLGDLGISAQDRAARVAAIFELIPTLAPDAAEWFADISPHCATHDGGQLSYLLETPDGSMFVNPSSGYWSGIVANLRPDVAVLALTGRPNINGEPHQGSLARFLVDQVELLRPGKVVLCHHDALLPPLTAATDTSEALAMLSREAGHAQHVDLAYADPVEILRRPRG